MKMRDTFTNIFPGYDHKPETCYRSVDKSITHHLYPIHEKNIEGKPMAHIERNYTHKMDDIKDYSEEMYKLGVFAPPPRKAAVKGPGFPK